jgi:RimJ/RimL family protein N-acetyltransferase
MGAFILHNYDKYSNRIMFTIAIAEKFQGKGYGKSALDRIVDFIFSDKSIRRIYIEVYETNVKAINIYQSCGFKKEGILQEHSFKNGEYINLVIMGLLNKEM